MLRTNEENGRLVGAGLVALAVAVILIDTRFSDEWPAGGRLVIVALPALLALAIAFYSPGDDVPPPWLSAILVVEFVLVLFALGELADALGADGLFDSAGALTWVGALATALAVGSSIRHNSAVMALIAGVSGVVTLLAFADWAFGLDEPLRTFRWLLMLAAIGLAAGGFSLRASRPRHAVASINAAGLTVLGLALTFAAAAISPFGSSQAGWGWELFVLAAGGALLAYAVSNREPGPGYLGAANLLAFVLMASDSGEEPSLVGWPLVLLIVAFGILAFALRPGSARTSA